MTVILPVLLLVTLMEPPPSAALSNTLPPSDEASADPPALPAALPVDAAEPQPGDAQELPPRNPGEPDPPKPEEGLQRFEPPPEDLDDEDGPRPHPRSALNEELGNPMPARSSALEGLGTAAGLLGCVPLAFLGALLPGYLMASVCAGCGGASGAAAQGAIQGFPLEGLLFAPYMALLGFGFSFVPVYGPVVQVMCGGPGVFLQSCALMLLPLPVGSALGGGLARWALSGFRWKAGAFGALLRLTAAVAFFWPLAGLVSALGLASTLLWGAGSMSFISGYAEGDATTQEEAEERRRRAEPYRSIAPWFFVGGTALAGGALLVAVVGAVAGSVLVLEPLLWRSRSKDTPEPEDVDVHE